MSLHCHLKSTQLAQFSLNSLVYRTMTFHVTSLPSEINSASSIFTYSLVYRTMTFHVTSLPSKINTASSIFTYSLVYRTMTFVSFIMPCLYYMYTHISWLLRNIRFIVIMIIAHEYYCWTCFPFSIITYIIGGSLQFMDMYCTI